MRAPLEVGQALQITIEAIEQIAKSTMAELQHTADSTTSGFRSHKLPAAAFSPVPKAQQLAEQQDAAHDVFVRTIEGVLADLRDFQANLLACAKAHAGTDDGVQGTLQALGERYRDHRFHADTAFETSRAHEGRKLHGTGVARGATPEPAATGPATAPATGPATGPATADQPSAPPSDGPGTSGGTGF
ncbi:MAG TPA: hypothetical protein VFM09_13070 [Marmoricola sp.]|nr:hypothetical protein [Marmoricola sp.]